MTCLKDLEKILEGKKGYKELLEKINQEDFFGIEGTDSRYMKKYVFIENNEIRDNIDSEKLEVEGINIIHQVINGDMDVSEYVSVKFYEDTINKLTKQEVILFFSKFKKLRNVYLWGLELHKVDWGKDILLKIIQTPNIKSLNLGKNRLHLVDWGKDILLKIIKAPNIKSFSLGWTKLEDIEWGEKVLLEFAKSSNIKDFDFWMTNLENIDGGDEILLKFIKNPNIKKISLGSNLLNRISGGDKILLKLLKKTNLEYLNLGTTAKMFILKGYLPEKIRYLLKEQMKKEDLEKIRKALGLIENG